jgi:hypothetical protein
MRQRSSQPLRLSGPDSYVRMFCVPYKNHVEILHNLSEVFPPAHAVHLATSLRSLNKVISQSLILHSILLNLFTMRIVALLTMVASASAFGEFLAMIFDLEMRLYLIGSHLRR